MKNLLILTILFAFTVSATNAFAWSGNGRRQNGQQRIPVDAPHSQKAASRDEVIVKVAFYNKNNETLKCDAFAQITGGRHEDRVNVKAYLDGQVLRPSRAFEAIFPFYKSDFGTGFRFIRSSQKYELSCLEVYQGESPVQVPQASQYCDPEYDDCDYTCQSSQSSQAGQMNTQRCANQNQTWSDDDQWVSEW